MTMPEAPNERRSLNTNSNVNFFDTVGAPNKSGAKSNNKAVAGARRPAVEQLYENRLHLQKQN